MGVTPRSWGCMPRRRRPGYETEVCGTAVAWGGTPAFEAAPQTCWSTRKIPVQSARVSDGHSTSLRPDKKLCQSGKPSWRSVQHSAGCAGCVKQPFMADCRAPVDIQAAWKHWLLEVTAAQLPDTWKKGRMWARLKVTDLSNNLQLTRAASMCAPSAGCQWPAVYLSVHVCVGRYLLYCVCFCFLWVELWSELSDNFFVSCSQLKADKGVVLPERAPLQTDGFNSKGVAGDNRRACNKDIVVALSPQRNPL